MHPGSPLPVVVAISAFFCGSHSLSAQGTWVQRTPSASPLARYQHAMAYDSQHGRTVLFGGAYGSYPLSDTWTWDGVNWSLVAASLPQARTQHAMAYDSLRGKTVMFSGTVYSGYGSNGDTWEWNGATWTQAPAIGPPTRRSHAMAFDSMRGKTVMFGGIDNSGSDCGDTWEWDGSTWTQVATTGPSPRHGHQMAYDSQRGKTVLFGGSAQACIPCGETWEWDGVSWTLASSVGPARVQHAMVYDSQRSRTVAFGGGGSTVALVDTIEWDGSIWAQVATSGPPERYSPAMAYDSQRGRTVMFGGWLSISGVTNDTWEWEPTPPASYTSFGMGCVGPNGLTPTLAGAPGETPRPGTTSHLRIASLPSVVTLPVFLVGFSNMWDPDGYPLPLDLGVVGWPGCPQLVSDEILFWQITTSGQADQPITIPAGYPLGFTFHVQALVLYTPTGVALSNAVTGVVGY